MVVNDWIDKAMWVLVHILSYVIVGCDFASYVVIPILQKFHK